MHTVPPSTPRSRHCIFYTMGCMYIWINGPVQEILILITLTKKASFKCLCWRIQLRLPQVIDIMHNISTSDDIMHNIWAVTCDFQQCGILTSVDSDEPVQPPVNLRNSKCCSVSSSKFIKKFKWPAKALIRLRVCAGWSEALLVAHTSLLEISCHFSFLHFGLGLPLLA